MARTNNLTNFLTDVASAIKTKTGDSTPIPASQFDTKIADISTGNLSDEEYTKANNNLDEILYQSENVLPDTYQQVEYLESNGTQYIDTGVVPSVDIETDIDFEYVSLNRNYNRIFGTYGVSGFSYGMRGTSNSGGYLYTELMMSATKVKTDVAVVTGTRYSVKFNTDEHKLIIGNSEYAIPNVPTSSGASSQTIALFGQLYSSEYQSSNVKIYSCKMYDNGTLVRSFIPCYRKSDNKPGMYDTVNNVFYTNEGDGEFIVGEDVDVLNSKIESILTEKNAKILSANIKDGINILGIIGTYEGGGGSIVEKDVNFFDYDGTLVASYTKTEFLALTEMPTNPSHTGLVAQGWNWSLADAKEYVTDYGVLDIGQTYTTESGNSEFDVEVTAKTGLTVTCNMIGTKNWGDGTTDSYNSHTYSTSGKYTITCDGTSYNGSYIFGSSSSTIPYYPIAARMTKVANLPNYAFNNCYSLKYVTISNDITSLGSYTFSKCSALKWVTIPSTTTSISNGIFNNCYSLERACLSKNCAGGSATSYMFGNCYALKSLVIPPSAKNLYGNFLQNCYALEKLVIPISITTIANNAFLNCTSIVKYDFSKFSAIPTLQNTGAFTGINSICKIIIPDDLYNDWIVASNWSSYETYMEKASEY